MAAAAPRTMAAARQPLQARCVQCGQPATQLFHCGGCGLERAYCQQYACQADNWFTHPPTCRGLAGTIFKEDTTVTRLADGTTYSRRRRRSIVRRGRLRSVGGCGNRARSPAGSDLVAESVPLQQDVNADLTARTPVLELAAPRVIQPDHDGWLAHAGDTLQTWRLLYFIVKGDVLFCFDSEDALCRGAIALGGFQVRTADRDVGTKHALKLYHTDGRVHFFVAASKEDAEEWLGALVRGAAQQRTSPPLPKALGPSDAAADSSTPATPLRTTLAESSRRFCTAPGSAAALVAGGRRVLTGPSRLAHV